MHLCNSTWEIKTFRLGNLLNSSTICLLHVFSLIQVLTLVMSVRSPSLKTWTLALTWSPGVSMLLLFWFEGNVEDIDTPATKMQQLLFKWHCSHTVFVCTWGVGGGLKIYPLGGKSGVQMEALEEVTILLMLRSWQKKLQLHHHWFVFSPLLWWCVVAADLTSRHDVLSSPFTVPLFIQFWHDFFFPLVCIVGPNGVGKSTLLLLLTGKLNPVSVKIYKKKT